MRVMLHRGPGLLLLHHKGKSSSWPSLAAATHASQRLHDVMRLLFLRHCMLLVERH